MTETATPQATEQPTAASGQTTPPQADPGAAIFDPAPEAKAAEPKAEPKPEGEASKPAKTALVTGDAPKPEGEAPKDEAPKPEGETATAPDYQSFAMPEDMADAPVDADIDTEFKSTAKGLGLSQEQAQKMFDIGVKLQKKNIERWEQTVQGWQQEFQADKEFGGDRASQTLDDANRAVSMFGDAQMRDLLVDLSVGNHPAFIRMMARIGRAVKEDTVRGGTGDGKRPLSPAEILYGAD